MTPQLIQHLNFRLSEHPSIAQFRWSPTESSAATWWFLITSITAYISTAATIHILLRLLRREKAVPLGPIPALHSLAMSLVSATIFAGMLASSAAEIRATRWFWQRNRTAAEWLLCFPLGTRPSGRVFFWSYAFYLSRFLHASRTFVFLLRHPSQPPPLLRLIYHSFLVCMAFLWLEFSQSFQILAILSMTIVFALVYAYRFCVEIGVVVKESYFPFAVFCHIVLAAAIAAGHGGVLALHFLRGGCNGMGAWLFNAMINSFVLFFLLNFYLKKCLTERDDHDFAASADFSNNLLTSKSQIDCE